MWIEKKFQVSSRNVQSARVAFASTEAVDYISTKGGGQISSKNHIKMDKSTLSEFTHFFYKNSFYHEAQIRKILRII